jgi:DNA-binding NarL/FixJ family response regulator
MKTLRELASGTTAVSSDIARSVIGLLPRVHASCPTKFGLTPHEIRLLALLVDGYTFKAVAVMAGLKPSTVAWHMQRIYGKLQVHSKSEAVATALRNGITSSQMTEYR